MLPSNRIERSWLDAPDSEEPRLRYSTKHNPAGAPHLFAEEQIKEMVTQWQSDQRVELLNKILLLSRPLITGVILSRGAYTADMEETLHHLRIKIWKKLPNYDCSKGRLFTFLSLVCHQTLDELQARQRQYQERYAMTDVAVLESTPYSTAPEIRRTEILADLKWRIFQLKTICVDPYELESQRWLVRGLVNSDFELRRHQASDAMSVVFGISPRRSRTLHDATLLEARRQLLDVVQIPKIDISRLCGTRGHALVRYADQLSAQDFSKLVFLMRNLSPTAIIRGPLDWVLNGFPDARLLFDEQR